MCTCGENERMEGAQEEGRETDSLYAKEIIYSSLSTCGILTKYKVTKEISIISKPHYSDHL